MASIIKGAVSSATGHSSSSSTEKANTDTEGHDKTKNFRLRITAGPTYDKSLQRVLAVNSPQAHSVSENVAVSLRIRDYDGLPSTSPVAVPEYFELPEHSKDTFSVAWAFTPPHDMPASNLYFGIDTGHNPIRKFGISKSLINTAFKIVKEFIDPSLSCDAGVDEPFVRGPAVAGATTTLCVGDRQGPVAGEAQLAATSDVPPAEQAQPGQSVEQTNAHLSPNPGAASPPSRSSPPTSSSSSRKSSASIPVDLSGLVFPDPQLLTEGATSSEAQAHRKSAGLPSDAVKRRKHLNSESHRKEFILQKGRTYYFDFSNGYIDWKSYALKLPGFNIPVLKYLGGGKPPPTPGSSPKMEAEQRNGSIDSVEGTQAQTSVPPSPEGKKGGSGSHKVRFFLKDIASEEVYFVIMCTLLTGADLTQALEEDRAAHGGS